MAIVFLSYSRQDRDVAAAVQNAVENAGLVCWVDQTHLYPGYDIAVEITKAIRESDVFVILLSAKSNESEFVHKELAIAHHFRKTIIPYALTEVEPADDMLPYLVRLHRWSFMVHPPAAFATWLAEHVESSTTDREPKPDVPQQSTTRLVSNAEYLRFVVDWKAPFPLNWRSSPPHFDPELSDHPVTCVSWDEATSYCDWAGGCLPFQVRTDPSIGLSEVAHVTAEWCNAGDSSKKYIFDTGTNHLRAIMPRDSRIPVVGFRCLRLAPTPLAKRIIIPGGNYLLGTDMTQFSRIASAHRVPIDLTRPMFNRPATMHSVPTFAMSSICVTNEEYFAFVEDTGSRWPYHWHSRWIKIFRRPFPCRVSQQPVVNVTADEARRYCIWKRGTRLLTSHQWESAASGPTKRAYPWGSQYDSSRCNSFESEFGALAAVHDFTDGDTPDGAHQLCGNVAEWVIGPDGQLELRGGSYKLSCEVWGLSYAFLQKSTSYFAEDVGFRVVFT